MNFSSRHYPKDLIFQTVRWYLRFNLSLVYVSVLAIFFAGNVSGQEPTPIGNATALDGVVRNDPEGNYVLTNHIYLNESYPTWIPIGTPNQPFRGTFDGNQHFIYGLNVKTSNPREPAGLFGFIQNAWIQGVMLDRPYVLSTGDGSPAGALVGEMERSNITQSINYQGLVRTEGHILVGRPYFYSSAGGLLGWMKDGSYAKGNLNTGEVSTNGGGCHAGGIAGQVNSNSPITNNVNTGRVSTNSTSAYAGGIAGQVNSNSPITNNVNTGRVSTNRTSAYASAYAGGIAGQVNSNSPITNNVNTGGVSTNGWGCNAGGIAGKTDNSNTTHNLNTGWVSTSQEAADVGGVLGYAYNSHTTHNVNTGWVSNGGGNEWGAHAGGVAGYASNSPTTHNINIGEVRINGKSAHAGGIAGYASNSTTTQNLNTGEVITNGTDTNAGGIAGRTERNSLITQNLNIGEVSTNGTNANAGGIAGYANNSPITQNLNIGEVSTNGTNARAGGIAGNTYNISPTTDNLYNGTVVAWNSEQNHAGSPIDLQTLKQGLNGLNRTLWRAGNNTELPMLKGINAAYWDLYRINGTAPGNNTFSEKLLKFANPGGSNSNTLFDRMVWNVEDGFLPFLKSINQEQSQKAKINCCPGGFACAGDFACVAPSTVAPSTIIPSPDPNNCTVPMGRSLFHVYKDSYLYVVAQDTTAQLLLVRYDAEGILDTSFGVCGVQAWLEPDSLDIRAGVVHQDSLYLALTDALMELPLSGDPHRSVSAPANVKIQSLTTQNNVLYYGGQSHGNFFVERVSLPLESTLTELSDTLTVSDGGSAYALMIAGKHLYAAGQGAGYGVMYQYQNQSLAPVSFVPGKEKVNVEFEEFPDLTQSQVQALAVHDGWLYLVGNLDSPGRDEDLFIRRYRLEDGEEDGRFAIPPLVTGLKKGQDALDYEVHVQTSENGLTVIKHSTDDDQVFVGSWNWQGRAVSDNGLRHFPGMVQLARGLGLGSNRMYLAGTDADGFLVVEQDSWTLPVLGSPTASPASPSDVTQVANWVWPTVAAGGLVLAAVGVAAVVIPVAWMVKHHLENKAVGLEQGSLQPFRVLGDMSAYADITKQLPQSAPSSGILGDMSAYADMAESYLQNQPSQPSHLYEDISGYVK